MEQIQRVSRTDLARHTRSVINSVMRGHAAMIESHGEPEVAVIDIVDYRILRAVMRYHAQQPVIDSTRGLDDMVVAASTDPQRKYNIILAHYLAGAISLSRVAELLGVSWVDVRTRFLRLDVPLRLGPVGVEDALNEVETALRWGSAP